MYVCVWGGATLCVSFEVLKQLADLHGTVCDVWPYKQAKVGLSIF